MGGSYAYVRGKSRSAMKDGTAASILLTSELENLLADIRVGWESSFQAPQLLHWPHSRVGLSAKQSYC